MPDIKIKVKPQATIKNIDKRIVGVQKIKNNLITTKEKIPSSSRRPHSLFSVVLPLSRFRPTAAP